MRMYNYNEKLKRDIFFFSLSLSLVDYNYGIEIFEIIAQLIRVKIT